MKAKGLSARPGDTIPYVICQGDSSSPAQRAFHPDDIAKENLKIGQHFLSFFLSVVCCSVGAHLSLFRTTDLDWYLKQQVHPPVSRLCEPIEGTDIAQIADCLGLDGSKFAHTTFEPTQFQKFSTQMSDAERFKSARSLQCHCVACKKSFPFEGVLRDSKDTFELATICPNKECRKAVSVYSLCAQLSTAIRQDIEKYYERSLLMLPFYDYVGLNCGVFD